MKRLITLCIVLSAIALISAPLFAEVQNVKVSGDIDTNAVYREDYLLLSNNQGAADEFDNVITTSARVRVDADLTDNVSASVRFLTEYDWDTETNTGATGDNVDLDLANVTLKEVFYAPLSVTVGRQELRYGNAFVIGDPDTNTTSTEDLTDGTTDVASAGDLSLRKSFDAIKGVLDYDPLVIDLVYAKIDETDAAIDSTSRNDDATLYGINVAYDIGQYDAEVEGYWFLLQDDDDTAPTPTTASVKQTLQIGDEIHTWGLRGSIVPVDNLNLLGEVAWQTGIYDATTLNIAERDQSAVAYQIAGDYTFSDFSIPWVNIDIAEPMLKLGWTHYDGEEVGNEGDHEAWIPLFEDQAHGVVANYILGGVNGGQNSNADILNVGTSLSPLDDLNLSLDFYYFRLDEKLVGNNNNTPNLDLQNESTALGWTNLTEASYFMMTDDDLGWELDLALNYDYTEDVKMGLVAGWFTPGDAFDGANAANSNDETALEVLASLDVAF